MEQVTQTDRHCPMSTHLDLSPHCQPPGGRWALGGLSVGVRFLTGLQLLQYPLGEARGGDLKDFSHFLHAPSPFFLALVKSLLHLHPATDHSTSALELGPPARLASGGPPASRPALERLPPLAPLKLEATFPEHISQRRGRPFPRSQSHHRIPPPASPF